MPLSWILLRETIKRLGINPDPKALYIDVDVHHANGFAYCCEEIPGLRDNFFMVDLYNSDIYPIKNGDTVIDEESLEYLSVSKPFPSNIGTRAYLKILREALDAAEKLPVPDIIYYMANNDTLTGDPLGRARVTPKGILKRDRMVLTWARDRDIPIVMFPGAGYAKNGCSITRDVLVQLNNEFGLWKSSFKRTKH